MSFFFVYYTKYTTEPAFLIASITKSYYTA